MTDRPADAAPFSAENIARLISGYGHGGYLGLAYADSGTDWVELTLDWRADLVGDVATGVLASAPIFALMDNATSMSVWTRLGYFRPQATMDLRIDYLRPSPPGARVTGRGECYHVTHNVGFVRGVAHNGDPADPIAHVAGTFFHTRPRA